MKRILMSLLVVGGIAQALFAGNLWDLERFNNNPSCVGCKLSGYDLGPIVQKHKKQNPNVQIDLSNADLEDCRFQAVEGPSDLSNINFEGSNLRDAYFGPYLGHTTNLKNSNFSGAILNFAYFVNLNLFGANFTNARGLETVVFKDVKNASQANWTRTLYDSHKNWKVALFGLWKSKS